MSVKNVITLPDIRLLDWTDPGLNDGGDSCLVDLPKKHGSWGCTLSPNHLGSHQAWAINGLLCAVWDTEDDDDDEVDFTYPDLELEGVSRPYGKPGIVRCLERHPNCGYVCTLETGHDGIHQAWGMVKLRAMWGKL